MGIWEQLPVGRRRNGEQVLWEGAAAVSTAAVVHDQPHPIDTAGVDLGWLIVTSQQVLVGHRRKKLLGAPKVECWDAFSADDVASIQDHPMGVAFEITRFGPVDMLIAAPARDLDGLRTAVNSFWLRS